jgi:polyamine oxidase
MSPHPPFCDLEPGSINPIFEAMPARIRALRSRRLHSVLAAVLCCALLALISNACPGGACISTRRERVLIVGAGAAGLAAAVALSSVADVVVFEAQERLGGRVHTNRALGAPIELGAAWIHRADGNVVSELARSFGCGTFVSENKALRVYADDGAQYRPATVEKVYNELRRRIMPEFLQRRSRLGAGQDVDMERLMRRVVEQVRLDGGKRCVLDFLLFRDIVQDHTSDLRQSSARHYDTYQYGGRGKDVVLPAGYDCVMTGLARGLQIVSGKAGEVVRLSWGDHGVEVHTADGRSVAADRAIVTVPLGVLKASLGAPPLPRGALQFEPPIPSQQRLAIHRMGFGEALKVGLRFPRVFWPADAHFLGKVGGSCDRFGTARHLEFLNVARYTGEPVLLMETETEWARALHAMDDERVVSTVVAELRRMFPDAPQPTAHVVYRLANNSFQRGAFTYMPAGGTSQWQQELALPLAGGRLMFAGEHTSVLHAGTVHGAIVAGRQAAAQARAAMRGAEPSAAGMSYFEDYRERLYRANYGDDDSHEGEGESWDRNP